MKRYKKIQLVSPPSNRTVEGQQKWARWPQPIGLMSIATYVNSVLPDVELEVLDYDCVLDLDNEQDAKRLGNADLVGLSVTFAQVDRGLEIARLAKDRGADVVIGGNIATAMNESLMGYHDEIDYCVCQDGEESMLELIRGADLSSVPNLIWRENGSINANKIVPVDLTTLPIIDRGYIRYEDYLRHTTDEDFEPLPQLSRPANMYSQKGCSWRASVGGGCLFCSIHDVGHRTRKPEDVWKERQYLVNDYGVNYIWDPSDNFAASPEWLQAFYDARPPGFVVPFSNYIRVDYVTDERIRMLKEMGCVQVFMGMESGSNVALKALNKGTSTDLIEEAIAILGKYKITTVMGLVIGAAGETQETVLETLDFIKYLLDKYPNVDRFEWGTLAPLPGSKAHKAILEHPELKDKYKSFGKGNIMSQIEQMIEDWPEYMCGDAIDFDYFLYLQQLAQEHLPYRMTRYQKRAWTGTLHKLYVGDELIKRDEIFR